MIEARRFSFDAQLLQCKEQMDKLVLELWSDQLVRAELMSRLSAGTPKRSAVEIRLEKPRFTGTTVIGEVSVFIPSSLESFYIIPKEVQPAIEVNSFMHSGTELCIPYKDNLFTVVAFDQTLRNGVVGTNGHPAWRESRLINFNQYQDLWLGLYKNGIVATDRFMNPLVLQQ